MHGGAAGIGGGFRAVLALHVVAAAIWVGGGTALVALSELAHRHGRTDLGAIAERVRRYVFLPAALSVLGLGLGLVSIGGFAIRTLWVALALGGWTASFVAELPLATSDPLGGARAGANPARRAALGLHLARVQAVLLVLVLVDMVIRPGG